ncbi:MAG: hypothetical protein AAB355_02680 [Patescibacteria group bacterium]
MKKITIAIFSFLPLFALAAGLVPCGGVDTNGAPEPACNFDQLVIMAQRIIRFLILIGGSLGAVAFAYAGWLYLTSGGNPGKVTSAKDIFIKVVLGFIFMLAAWLIVSLIVNTLGYQGVNLLKG